MGINYPGDVDFFTVPTLPEETSLSSAGTTGQYARNHTQLHDDINKAVMALENNAALKTHDHNGVDGRGHGLKLTWTNTHQASSGSGYADTDLAPTSIHHTLGTGANQAAPGNHTHTVATVPQHYQIVSSTSAVTSPYAGLMVFETSTNMVKVWATYSGTTGWNTVFGAPPVVVTPTPTTPPPVPVPTPVVACRLRQGLKQKLVYSGTVLEWHEELDDTLNFFNPASSLTSIVIRRAGMYQIDCAIQWDSQIVPDVGKAVLCINGQETSIRVQQTMKGNLQVPGFSQTLALSGKLKFNQDDVLTVKVGFEAPNNILSQIFSFVEQVIDAISGQNSKVQSRIDIVYVGT